jgi:hypothetical protein
LCAADRNHHCVCRDGARSYVRQKLAVGDDVRQLVRVLTGSLAHSRTAERTRATTRQTTHAHTKCHNAHAWWHGVNARLCLHARLSQRCKCSAAMPMRCRTVMPGPYTGSYRNMDGHHACTHKQLHKHIRTPPTTLRGSHSSCATRWMARFEFPGAARLTAANTFIACTVGR